LLKNVGSNWVYTLVTIAVAFVLTPFLVKTLGTEGYGTWMLITSMTGYLSLLALGVPMASVRYIAEHVAEDDECEVNRAIGSSAGLYVFLGSIALLVGVGLLAVFATYDIPQSIEVDANVAFVIAVLFAASGFIALLPEGIMHAYDEFVPRNMVRVGVLLLRFFLTLWLLSLRPSLALLASILLGCQTLDFLASRLLIKRAHRRVRISLRDFDWAEGKRIFTFSLFVLLIYAGTRLSFETDSLVIGAFLDVGSIAYYTVSNSFLVYLMQFIVSIGAVVLPMATRLKTQGRSAELEAVFLKWSKVALSVTMAATLFLVVLGPRFIAWWIDPSFENPSGPVLQILMLSSLLFLPMRGVALPVLIGLGKPGIPTIGFLVTGLVNVGISIALVGQLGLNGVALGTAIPNVLFAIVVIAQACQELGVGLMRYTVYVFPRVMLGALPVLGVLLWFRDVLDVRSLAGLFLGGSAMCVAFALVWIFFVYRGDPYFDARSQLARLTAWSRR